MREEPIPPPEPETPRRRLQGATLGLVGLLSAVWGVQFLAELALGDRAELIYTRLGASRAALAAGHWETLLTSIFLHAGLWHIAGNAIALASLGGPVEQAFGGRRGRWLWYPLFFLCSGIVASAGYVLLHFNGAEPAVGASGAICGVWGALARIYSAPPGYISRVASREVWRQTQAFLVSNLAVIGGLYALTALAGDGAVVVAWEAHAAGYLFGQIGRAHV